MASYRPFPPQSSFGPPPNQNPLTPTPPPPPPQRGNQYNQNWGYNYNHSNYGPPRTQHPHPQPQYNYPPLPPPPESSYPPPPPPQAPPVAQNKMPLQPPRAPMYYQNSQYSQYSHQPIQPLQQPPPPPPPPFSPSSSAPPPPPPPGSPPPPPPQSKDGGVDRGSHEKVASREVSVSGRGEHGHLNHGVPQKQHKPPVPSMQVKKANGPPGRVETEEERRLRKKREFEKQRQEEKHRQQLKDSQNSVLQKTQMLSSGKGHGSIAGSRMGERRATPFLSGERTENRLKKPTTFVCKLKFRNELPDPSAQPKLMSLKKDKDHPPSVRPPLALEDEELLRDDVAATPVKKNGIKRKERPTDKGVAWLVKTQYISPLSMDSARQSLTEKQAKELREMKGGRNILDNLNDRERQIKEIEASFEACKSRPVHATNKDLYPVEVLPLLPDFERYEDQFVLAAFDGAPTADSEIYSKLDQSGHDAYESRAIMKSYKVTGADPANPEKFLAYMVPSPNELSKDPYDESEDVSYSWVREYHYDVRGDDVHDPTTYLVSFDEEEARYAPLPTKLVLRKKRSKEGKTSDEVEHFPAPSRVTVRQRSTVAAIELKDSGDYSRGSVSNLKTRRFDIEDTLERPRKIVRHQDIDEYSGAEDDLSD
ncbi:protein PAF1 homolog isoform X2 [Prunus dulcis]|uniref:protein PAF1 homolog isoform X2 n=1 Tax=Prunus dulcis TaxID=3755 RepID=UPI0014834B0B|nr:protein PAF1 homolog isoform X2 [Prunus dulcis]